MPRSVSARSPSRPASPRASRPRRPASARMATTTRACRPDTPRMPRCSTRSPCTTCRPSTWVRVCARRSRSARARSGRNGVGPRRVRRSLSVGRIRRHGARRLRRRRVRADVPGPRAGRAPDLRRRAGAWRRPCCTGRCASRPLAPRRVHAWRVHVGHMKEGVLHGRDDPDPQRPRAGSPRAQGPFRAARQESQRRDTGRTAGDSGAAIAGRAAAAAARGRARHEAQLGGADPQGARRGMSRRLVVDASVVVDVLAGSGRSPSRRSCSPPTRRWRHPPCSTWKYSRPCANLICRAPFRHPGTI